MLKQIKLKNVGPAPEMTLDLGDRLNIITGDNGLGKSFLLDVAWWCLTRKWPQDVNSNLTSGYPARPRDVKQKATIQFNIKGRAKTVDYTSTYDQSEQSWLGKAGRPINPGLVIYAQADGSFSVWDPARNYWKTRGRADVYERLPSFVFSPKEVWDGLWVDIDGQRTLVCKGLIADWANWIDGKVRIAALFDGMLNKLSPPSDTNEVLRAGDVTRISINDGRDIPTIFTSYSEPVPILYASAGIKRVVALSYMLFWAWLEHQLAAEKLGLEVTHQVTFFIDELECHLHPRWQRTILNSLLEVGSRFKEDIRTQLVVATHSPLVLASAEPFFDANKDAWFDLDLVDGVVQLNKRDYVPLGDVASWLTSDAFDLSTSRSSVEAEKAYLTALALLRKPEPSDEEINEVDRLLQSNLTDTDRFWMRWTEFRKKRQAAHASS